MRGSFMVGGSVIRYASMSAYDHKKIEKKWQEEWARNKIYTTPDAAPGKDNFYLLVEFPYPSGNLHVGHWYAFAVPDILARAMRMQGKNVLYPIGFDAFGLPAENAAIKNKLNPRDWTEKNIEYMTKQIESMGTSFDWSRKVSTIDPAYYKWTQWLFLQLYKKGLVYQKETAVNWCPTDKTVLANEQVVDGTCERCGAEVMQKQMLQWNIKITEYADRLVDDLTSLDWPEQIKESQRNWIGRSEGAEIDFKLSSGDVITVFTTRPDTLFGATYLVLAPEHETLKRLQLNISNWSEVEKYLKQTEKKTELERQADQKEKTGVKLEGVEAVNPATGEKIPLFVADYVLGNYGTGAIMAVPAHDERDYAFAQKFNVPIRQVIRPVFGAENRGKGDFVFRETVSAVVRRKDGKIMLLDWPVNKWITTIIGGIEKDETPAQAAEREVLEETGYKARAIFVSPISIESYFFADHKKEWRSRIDHPVLLELVEDDPVQDISPEEKGKHSAFWVDPEKALQSGMYGNNTLAVELATGRITAYTNARHAEMQELCSSGNFDGMTVDVAKKAMTDKYGRAKNTYRLRDWIVSRQRYWGVPIPMVHCEKCGAQPVPDNQLPVELPAVDDYLPDGKGKSPLAKVESFVNIACPQCGGAAQRETDTLDTFVDSSWYFVRYSDPHNASEFAAKEKQEKWLPVDLYSGGAEHTTMHLLYSRFWHKALFDMGLVADPEPYTRRMNRSIILGPDGQKMSKSRGNVIDPDDVVDRLGADTVRMYLAFIGPYNEVANYPWNPDGVVGVRRFLERVWKLGSRVSEEDEETEVHLNYAIKKVTEDIAKLKFNTAIAAMMVLVNAAESNGIGTSQYERLLKLIAPFAPHISEELWHQILNKDSSIHTEEWPQYDPKLLERDTVTLAIQINGKTRGEVSVASDADKSTVEAAAREAVGSRLEGQKIARVIVVPKRLVNFVLE